MMKVPNKPGLSPNNGLENVFLSDYDVRQAIPARDKKSFLTPKRPAMMAMAGYVMTHVCHPQITVTV